MLNNSRVQFPSTNIYLTPFQPISPLPMFNVHCSIIYRRSRLLALPAICHAWSLSPPSVQLLFVSSSEATTQFQLLLAALTGVAESVVYICLLVFLKMMDSSFSIFPFCMLPLTRRGEMLSCLTSCNQKYDNIIRDTLLRNFMLPLLLWLTLVLLL